MTWTRVGGGFVAFGQVNLALRANRTIWLATTRPDGRPHVAPVWFLWDGHRACFSTGTRTQKAVNLRGQSWAVLHLGDGDEVVMLEGPAAPVTDPARLHALDEAYGDKYPQPVTGQRAPIRPTGSEVVYELRPERITSWSYGNVRSRTVWTSPAPPH